MLTKKCSKCQQVLPTSFFGRDSSTLDGLKYRCKPCIKADKAEFRKKNPEKVKSWLNNWKKKNPEKVKAGNRERTAKWNQNNREKRREMTRAWFESNPGMKAMYSAERRSAIAIQSGMLKDSDNLKIREIYKEAKAISLETGIPHHVDHIFPLKGKNCSGLHVPWNLRIVTAEENLKKNAKMPDRADGLAFLRISSQ